LPWSIGDSSRCNRSEDKKEMIDAIKKQGVEVKLTIYPDAKHDAWTETYNNPELYDWLLTIPEYLSETRLVILK
jgi:hypothetical protein